MKKIIVMCPTIQRALWEYYDFLNKYGKIIKKANKINRYIELMDGTKIYFKGEVEGPRCLKGFKGKVIGIDSFIRAEYKETSERICDSCKYKGKSATIEMTTITRCHNPNVGVHEDDKRCEFYERGTE